MGYSKARGGGGGGGGHLGSLEPPEPPLDLPLYVVTIAENIKKNLCHFLLVSYSIFYCNCTVKLTVTSHRNQRRFLLEKY